MSTLVRRLALYKAQEGATISDLEQLQASISLPSTIKMILSLRKFTKFSAALMAVWSFYYLGSQSNKREYGYAPSNPYHRIRAVYPTNDAGYLVDFSSNSSNIEYLNQLFKESLNWWISKNAIKGIDNNGRVLIPRMDPSIYSDAIKNSHWIHFQPSEVLYSAVGGRALSIEPQVGLDTGIGPQWEPQKIVGDYTFNTTFLEVRCESVGIYPESAFPSNVTPGMWTSINKTDSGSPSRSQVAVDVWGRWNESYWWGDPSQGEINGSTSGSIKVTCKVNNLAVNVQVHCSEVACLAKAIQYLPPNITEQFVNPLDNDNFAADFFSSLLLSYGPPTGVYSTLYGTELENFIGLYQLILDIASGEYNVTDVADLTWKVDYSMTSCINTYYNLALPDRPYLMQNQTPGPAEGYGPVSVIGGLYDPHYALFWPWLAISYISASILVAAAVFSFWLRRRTLAPDIFGYVSTLTRDNPHLLAADGGSALSGIDRARYLKDMKIRIGDVYGQNGEIGRVGVTIVQDAENVGPLRKERKYA